MVMRVKFDGSVKEKESKLSKELSLHKSIIVKAREVGERDYGFTNDFNFTLFSVSYFVQVKQDAIALILNCSIPKTFGEFKSFHGVCVLSAV